MKNAIKSLAAAVAMALAMFGADAYAVTASSSTTITPGVWNSNFDIAKKYAIDKGMPLMAVWSKNGCHFCNLFDEVLETSAFKKWAAERKIVMIYLKAHSDNDFKTARDWIRGSNADFPFVRIYWEKKGQATKSDQFIGRKSKYASGATTEEQPAKLVERIEKTIGAWKNEPEYAGGKFKSTAAREVYFANQSEATSKMLDDVSATRTITTPTNQTLRITYADGTVVDSQVEWDKESEKAIDVEIDRDHAVVGSAITVALRDGKNEKNLSSFKVNVVEPPYLGGEFKYDEIQATPATEQIYLNMSRDTTDTFSQKLVVSGDEEVDEIVEPDSATGAPLRSPVLGKALPQTEYDIDWKEGETNKTVCVSLAGFAKDIGSILTLTLMDGEVEMGSSEVAIVAEPSNSPSNPLFVGTKTADELAWGEWTMDLDVAIEKVVAERGNNGTANMLVLAAGSLWCPDCAWADANVFDQEEFRTWAQTSHVALVCIDLTGRGRTSPSLLSYDNIGGANYLTRNGISPEAAKEVFDRNHDLAWNHWFQQPDAGAAAESGWVGVPTVLSVRLDDVNSVSGQIKAFSDYARYLPAGFNPAYLTRFNELFKTLDDPEERNNGYWSTTEVTLGAKGSVEGTLSGADIKEVVYLSELSATTVTRITAASETELTAPVTMNLLAVTGDVATVAATATGLLGDGVSFTTEDIEFDESATYYVQLLAAQNRTAETSGTAGCFSIMFDGASEVAYTLSTDTVYVPEETLSENVPAVDASVTLRLVEGETYRLDGFDVDSDSFNAAFAESDVGEGFFTALAGGDIQLDATERSVSFQLWHPGTVAFKTSGSVAAFEFNPKPVVLTVSRKGGVSGAASVTLVKTAEIEDPTPGRYTLPETLTLEWGEGDASDKTFTIGINPVEGFQTTDWVVFGLEPAVVDPLFDVGASTVRLTIADTDKPCFGSTSYEYGLNVNFDEADNIDVYNLLAKGTVTLKKLSGSLPAGMSLAYDKKTGKVVLSGSPTKAGTYTAKYVIKSGSSTGDVETTFTFTVADPHKANPFVGVAYNNEVPLVSGDRIVGSVAVSVTSKNKISAKYTGPASSTVSFSGKWSGFDDEGTATAVMKTKNAKLLLSLDKSGVLGAELTGVSNALSAGGALAGETASMKSGKYAAFKGYYTVTLPADDSEGFNGYANGTGYICLTMTSTSDVKAGLVRYAGVLGNGTAISGTTNLKLDPDDASKAVVAIFKRSAKDAAGLAFTLCANAKDLCSDAETLQVINGVAGLQCYMAHTQANYAFGNCLYVQPFKVYGGYYNKGLTPVQICALYEDWYEPPYEGTIALNGEGFLPSAKNGELTAVASATATATSKGFTISGATGKITLSFAKATGLLTGKATLTFGSKTVTGTLKGVLLPGWTACGECGTSEVELTKRPFASGTVYYSDKVNGKTENRSVPFDLEMPIAE